VVLAAAPDGAFESADVDSVMALAQQVSVALHNASLRDAQTNFFTHVTELLVSSLDLYVDSQVGHSKRVAYFCNLLGRAAELDEARLGRLYFAALLHDIGMLRLPRQSPAHVGGAEFREHPAHSGAMLEPITFWSDLVPFVRHHHERWDGRGYPDGLAAEAIPVEARIIGLTEAFDAMTHPHSYRPRRSTADALEEIERCAGSQFDPALAETFVSLVRRGEIQVE
jgi:polar amino acid transport system substrate-binding protein